MEFLKIIGVLAGCFCILWMYFKIFELLAMPILIVILRAIYIPLGKRKEFDKMVAEYRAKKMKSWRRNGDLASPISITPINMDHCCNPSTGMPMVSGTSTDVGGNGFGMGKWN